MIYDPFLKDYIYASLYTRNSVLFCFLFFIYNKWQNGRFELRITL